MSVPSAFSRVRPVWRRTILLACGSSCLLIGTGLWLKSRDSATFVATVSRGTLIAQLTTTGLLRPIQSLSYHSPVVGRETEIVDLVPEGTHVREDDLLARLDTSELRRDEQRVQQELRQARLDLETGESERQEAFANVKAVTDGDGALTVDEVRTKFQLAQKKANRLREEYEQLKPLLNRGFITREELSKTADALDQADEELELANKRMQVTVQLTHPRETQRAAVQLSQKERQLDNIRVRVQDAEARLVQLAQLIKDCSIRARRPGLVVYEEMLAASPRRKIRVGDRVSSTQGLVTIPEVNRMTVETSVSEAEVHRVHDDQTALIHLEAFPELRLTGRVVRIGTLASASVDHPLDEKRFDVVIELDPTTTDLRPEMTARADINVGSVADGLLVPVNAIFQEGGSFVAHVAGPTGIQTRRVTLGDSNDSFVVVTAGLHEGERVMLVNTGGRPPGASGAPAIRQRASEDAINVLRPH